MVHLISRIIISYHNITFNMGIIRCESQKKLDKVLTADCYVFERFVRLLLGNNP